LILLDHLLLCSIELGLPMTIHYPATFTIVVILGVIQALVASWGGILAVLALPDGRAKQYTKLQTFGFVVLALALFALTFAIGKLNDTNQFEADQKAVDAQNQQKTIQDELDKSLKLQGESNGVLQQLGQSKTPSQLEAISRQAAQILERQAIPVLPAPSPGPQNVAPPTPSAFQPPDRNSPSALQRELTSLIQSLRDTDNQTNQRGSTIVHMPSSPFQNPNVPSQAQIEIADLINGRAESYKNGYHPRIVDIRNRVLPLLHLSAQDLTKNEAEFNGADAIASAITPKPVTYQKLPPGPGYAFSYIVGYLGNLSGELRKASPPK
jgi:hypothetical protein